MSPVSPLCTSAETSTLAYGVSTVGWSDVIAWSPDSHVRAAWLAGSVTAALQPEPESTW